MGVCCLRHCMASSTTTTTTSSSHCTASPHPATRAQHAVHYFAGPRHQKLTTAPISSNQCSTSCVTSSAKKAVHSQACDTPSSSQSWQGGPVTCRCGGRGRSENMHSMKLGATDKMHLRTAYMCLSVAPKLSAVRMQLVSNEENMNCSSLAAAVLMVSVCSLYSK